MEAAAATPHLLHCGGFGRVAHLPALPGRRHRHRRGQFPRIRAVATEPKPSTSTSSSSRGRTRTRNDLSDTVSSNPSVWSDALVRAEMFACLFV